MARQSIPCHSGHAATRLVTTALATTTCDTLPRDNISSKSLQNSLSMHGMSEVPATKCLTITDTLQATGIFAGRLHGFGVLERQFCNTTIAINHNASSGCGRHTDKHTSQRPEDIHGGPSDQTKHAPTRRTFPRLDDMAMQGTRTI
jgi:hypothetical protein